MLLGQGDADRSDVVVGGRVHHHAAPTAADVQQPHALFEPELAADQVVFGGLSILERDVGVGEAGARVRHRFAQHQPVEVVAHVVVVGDGGGVTLLRVPTAPQACLLRRMGRGRPEHAEAGCRGQGLQQGAGTDLELLGRRLEDGADRFQHVALDVGIARYVRACEADLVGRPQDAP